MLTPVGLLMVLCLDLVLGRGAARMRAVRLGGPLMRPVRRNAADAREGREVHLYRDASAAPLLDLRRRLEAIMDVLDAMLRDGVSVARPVELLVQWQREATLEEFDREVEGWLPLLPECSLPRLTGQLLADVVQRKGATAGSLDGWGWREFKVLPLSWFDELARILTKVEDLGVWPDVLLDACITMIPKTDGDATPLGQRPLCVLPVVYRFWASARMSQLEDWFRSWVPDSVFSAGSGRGSVVTWYTTALDIEEVLSGIVESDIHLWLMSLSLLVRLIGVS